MAMHGDEVGHQIVRDILVEGDSISHNGEFVGMLSFVLQAFSGLNRASRQAFTNGRGWQTQSMVNWVATEMISDLRKQGHSDDDIADMVLSNDERVMAGFLMYEPTIRSYAQGGATAVNRSGSTRHLSWKHATQFITRSIVDNLQAQQRRIISDDQAAGRTATEKAETLCFLGMTGLNDILTTARAEDLDISRLTALLNDALEERVKNYQAMKAQGYKRFVLLNAPNPVLTPRFVNNPDLTDEQRQVITKAVESYNAKLNMLVEQHGDIELFDVAGTFKEIIEHPTDYGFDPEHMHEPILDQRAAIVRAVTASRELTYAQQAQRIFWDDLHPSQAVNTIMAEKLVEQLGPKFTLEPLPEALQSVQPPLRRRHSISGPSTSPQPAADVEPKFDVELVVQCLRDAGRCCDDNASLMGKIHDWYKTDKSQITATHESTDFLLVVDEVIQLMKGNTPKAQCIELIGQHLPAQYNPQEVYQTAEHIFEDPIASTRLHFLAHHCSTCRAAEALAAEEDVAVGAEQAAPKHGSEEDPDSIIQMDDVLAIRPPGQS